MSDFFSSFSKIFVLCQVWAASCPPRDDELSFSAQGRRDDEAGEESCGAAMNRNHQRNGVEPAIEPFQEVCRPQKSILVSC